MLLLFLLLIYCIYCHDSEVKKILTSFHTYAQSETYILYKKAVMLSPGEQSDAAVNFDTYRILQ